MGFSTWLNLCSSYKIPVWTLIVLIVLHNARQNKVYMDRGSSDFNMVFAFEIIEDCKC